MRRAPIVTARAHAKVNLDLRVLGTRPDGFHELRTVFQTIELHDTLICAQRRGPFTLKCRTPGVPLDDSNLVWRAAAALWKALGRAGEPRDTVVTIEKTIPMRGGPRRRQRGRGRGAPRARAAVGRRAADAAARGRRRRSAPTSRSSCRAAPRSGSGAAKKIYPLVDLPPHWIVIVRPAVWRLDRGGVLVVRRRPHGRAQGDRASCRSCRCRGRRGRRR